MTTPVQVRSRGPLLRWFLSPIPLHRVAVMRIIAYLFILVDIFLTTPWVAAKATAPQEFYRPLMIASWLHLPAPTFWYVTILQWALVIAAIVAATGWRPQYTGTIVAVLYLAWMFVGMAYGKVDHDRWAYLVLLFVLPTAGPAHLGELRLSERAGWAFQMVFVSVMLTYFLSAVAKVRFGGIDWVTGATLVWAVLRRGSWLVSWTLKVPIVLTIAQFVLFLAETLSPLMLLVRRPRARIILVCVLLSFHLGTFAAVGIIFLPHCIAILSILPWERFRCRAAHPAEDAPASRTPVSRPAAGHGS